ncbi:MAG: dihydroneopterin aldolase family protein [Promethearchaeota archaeon]
MSGPEDIADSYFDKSISNRERACFEVGIKLGAIFHSILSFPIRNDPVVLRQVELGFESSFRSQPYVDDIEVKLVIDDTSSFKKKDEFDYTLISEDMISVRVRLRYRGVVVVGLVRWVPELSYPLMYIDSISP